jgi:gliding motility-associated-like protein
MKKLLLGIFSLISGITIAQCEINTSASAMTITCGQSVDLSAYGSSTGQVVLDEDFDGSSFGAGWSSSPGSTSFTNPCSPGGVDGTPHAWMDNNTAVPRTLTSQPYDLTAASAGVSICFDLLFAEQGDAAPCEGPDEPDEGVFLQYSIDGGATWIDIYYFDPNGGNDPQLVNWNNWCFDIPLAAVTGNTMFRWHQSADSGADYDHWGIDNVQIFQNDINSEVTWNHDGYSYGLGSPGGVNPTSVAPTTTTTYTATIVTGTGDICTSDITIIVVDPVYDVNVSASPTTVCSGDCSDITGDAQIILDPGGIETYENNEFELVATGSASVNINIQTLNMTGVESGSIQEVCINGFNFSGSELCTNPFGGCNCNGSNIGFGESCDIDASSFNITLTSPNGCEITLVPANVITTTGIQDMCFVPSGGAGIGTGSGNYTGQFDPNDPLSNLDGCDANGVWTLEFNTGTGGLGFGFGSLTGWNITFDDPPITQPVNATWSPTTGLSSTNTIATTACPPGTTDYVLTLDNGVPGCPVHEETVTIVVDPCGGCIPPVFTVTDPTSACIPFSYNLTGAVSGTGVNIVTYHATAADASGDTNPLASTTVSTAASYFVRVEDPGDATCFSVEEIVVAAIAVDDASFDLTDYCVGTANAATNIITAGGTFTFNPAVADGATINGATGEITDGVGGTTYTLEYTTSGSCSASSTEDVTVNSSDDASFDLTDYCVGTANAATNIITAGGTFTFNPAVADGATINGVTGEITDGVVGTTYTLEYTTSGSCSASSTEDVTVNSSDDASFDLTDYCVGTANAATNIITAGGTFAFNPAVADGATINGVTGEITDGVGGTTYAIEYTTMGACSASSSENIVVNALPTPSIIGNTQYCTGTPAQLSTDQVYASYNWNNGMITQNGLFTVVDNPISVTITDLNGCVGTTPEVNVTEGDLVPQFNADVVSGCSPLTVVFTNTTAEPTSNCNWNFGNGSTASDCGPVTVTYLTEGTYDVSLTASTAAGCSGTTTENDYIYVEDAPTASFYVSSSNLSGLNTTVDLINTSVGATSYQWNFGDTSQSVSSENPSHTYPVNTPGTYVVELIAYSALGCSDTAWNGVTVKDELIYYVPNTFTPDDDGYNQEFKPVFTEGFDPYDYKLLIFNRWGEIIFESNDANFGWDGTYGGKQVQDGTYVWTIEFKTTQSDERVNINGHLNKLR